MSQTAIAYLVIGGVLIVGGFIGMSRRDKVDVDAYGNPESTPPIRWYQGAGLIAVLLGCGALFSACEYL